MIVGWTLQVAARLMCLTVDILITLIAKRLTTPGYAILVATLATCTASVHVLIVMVLHTGPEY